MGENGKTSYTATKALTTFLPKYTGYLKPENRKANATLFNSTLEGKIGPISTLAVTLGQRFGKVKKIEVLSFFSAIKKFSVEYINIYKLKYLNSSFATTPYLAEDDAEKISAVELDILTLLDDLFIALKTENDKEFLQEIINSVELLEEKFEELKKLFERRAELLNSYPHRHNKITAMLSGLDHQIKKHPTGKSVSTFTNSLVTEFDGFTQIYIEMLRIFQEHFAYYKSTIQSDESLRDAAIDYFSEYVKVIEISNSLFTSEGNNETDESKIKELLTHSDSIADILSELVAVADADARKVSARPGNILSKVAIIIVLVALIAAGILYYLDYI